MKRTLQLIRDRELAALGYLTGWRVVRLLPEPLVRRLFDWGADRASDNGRGMEMLRRNLTRVVGAENVTRELVRDSVRSYARYWREAFRLPALTRDEKLLARLTEGMVGREALDASVAKGAGVIFTLPHSGNWDMAGFWLVNNYGQFTTVAERVKPAVLFDAFVGFRESLGFEVLPLTGGAQPPFQRLREVLEQGGIVCLMGERDLRQTGVSVDFFGERTTMPAGSAQLAIDTGAALHVAHSWFYEDADGPGWGLSVSDEVEVTTLGETMQRVADLFAANIAAHPTDWHLLQPQWTVDIQERRARRGARGSARHGAGK
ncbi:phosphatidylinositol mannoside acyltransferase [Corynebacterium guangdongense]|uniref:KDO2-lipid IV(A) lauroyltransferase n=1 Tax=Corynebacterium guangdongense TaxID=1783348 RepID=A0ABU1ZX84_9CORY|nr:phosphatidylinositol mannoside acyltransferase [Corynebacterium guangdongense]MDR7329470.1 KDO2-lipid IV(A) lauroyltransferase [Corynebacterium guangdongense]WJZ18035.1 Phosphatidylinositol mannoside acyltransferase [Corynebacterium guangdongense]